MEKKKKHREERNKQKDFRNSQTEKEKSDQKRTEKQTYSRRENNSILNFFLKNQGNEFLKRDLFEYLYPNQKDKKQKKGHLSKTEETLEMFLFLLEAEGLIQKARKTYYRVAKSFVLKGKLSLNKNGDGFVGLPSGNEIFIPDRKIGTALDGDQILIYPTGVSRRDKLEGEIFKVYKRSRKNFRFRVFEKNEKYFLGKILDLKGKEVEGIIWRKSLMKDDSERIKLEDVLIVTLKEDPSDSPNFYEAVFQKFEKDNLEDLDFQRILYKYDYLVQYPDVKFNFPEEVNEKSVSDWKMRVDLRDLYTITIDGATAKDFDDAISFEVVENKIRFWVHIADVGYYIQKDSELDQEALERATSVYLANRVVPMLPPMLSENLCSLVANVNRLAFTVEMEADHEGNIFHAKFYKSVIKVNQRYTYDQAEKEIQAGLVDNWLVKLNQFTKALKQRRLSSGRVDLTLDESYVDFDPVTLKIRGVGTKPRLESNMLIEELMLSANSKVAEFLRKKKVPTLNRVHETMDEEKLKSLNQFLKISGVMSHMKDTSYSEIQKVQKKISGNPMEKIFNYMLLRSFMQAYYSGEHLGHWGLGFRDYCHFTSPIRRYPDLVVHRTLHSFLLDGEKEYEEEEIEELGVHCSEKERKANDAERDLFKLKALRFVEATGRTEFSGTITSFRPSQVYVELSDFPFEVLIDKSEFTKEFSIDERSDFSFYSKKYSREFFIGEKLDLTLEKIDYDAIRIFMKLRFPKKK